MRDGGSESQLRAGKHPDYAVPDAGARRGRAAGERLSQYEQQHRPQREQQRGSADSSTYGGAYRSASGADGGSTPPPDGPSPYEQWSGGKRKKPRRQRKFPWKPVAAGVLIAAVAFGGGMLAGGNVDFSAMSSENASDFS